MGDALVNEQLIVKQISEGDEQAFGTFVAHYGPELELAIYQVVKTNLPVRDILQDVFLSIWIAREKLATLESPRTWLFRMAYYRSYTWLRHQALRNKVHARIDEELLSQLNRNPVEENNTFEETKRSIQEAVSLLPPRTKSIYTLSREQNLSISDIAEHLNLSPQTVKNTLSTALKSIRAHLAQKGILLPAIALCTSFDNLF